AFEWKASTLKWKVLNPTSREGAGPKSISDNEKAEEGKEVAHIIT
ncbi:hypothetical protein NPIL_643491, partial [Nephila pilipes]